MNIFRNIVVAGILLFLISATINGAIEGFNKSKDNFKGDEKVKDKDTQPTKRPKIIVDEFDGEYMNEAGATWEISGKTIILYLAGSKDMGVDYSENLISNDVQGDIRILKLKYSDSDVNDNDTILTINKHTENLIEHDSNETYPDQIFKKK